MKLRTPSLAIGLVLALGSAAAGCGSDEMFTPELGTNERLIDSAAFARIARSDEGVEDLMVVGDLDGDGIDDAIIRSAYGTQYDNGYSEISGAVYVLYGGTGVTGQIDMATLPSLVHIGAIGADSPGVVALGDVDGDGLADFAVGIGRTPGCGVAGVTNPGENLQNTGAYIVYGSHTRLTGSHPIADVGAFLRNPVPCIGAGGMIARLGDIDGDGKDDFALGDPQVDTNVGNLLVYYGRSARLSGTVDLTTSADAVIGNVALAEPLHLRLGDVDGDGLADFVVETDYVYPTMPMSDTNSSVLHLVRGSATRLSGTLAGGDLGTSRFPVQGCFLWDPDVEALGDLDGDGLDDFALGNCSSATDPDLRPLDTTGYRVFYGRKDGFPAEVGPGDQDATLATPVEFESSSLLIAGDANGDGIPDLVLADWLTHARNGSVSVLAGRAGVRMSGVVDFIARSYVTYVGTLQRGLGNPCASSSGEYEALGTTLALGDLNGDHHPDLLIGALDNLPWHRATCDVTDARIYFASPPAGPNP